MKPKHQFPRHLFTAAIFSSLLGGCATLPSNGPTASGIVGQAKHDGIQQYVVSNIDAATADKLNSVNTMEEFLPIPPPLENIPFNVVTVGDVLKITIYEVGVSVFSASSGASGMNTMPDFSAHNEIFENVIVDENGTIELPYIGRVRIVGRTLSEAEQLIKAKMAGKSQSPEVTIHLTDSPRKSAYVAGDVRRPGRVPLTPAGERLLDVILAVGGPTDQPYNTVIRLTRGSVEQSVRLSNIRPSTSSNILLLSGDRIEVLRQPLTFVVLGSSGRVAEIPFDGEEISLVQALGKFGGLNDNQADPRAVFLFRQEQNATPAVPTVYRLNMMDPKSYFIAQNVNVRDKDLIYVASARANLPTKFVSILNQLFSPIVTVRALSK